MAATKNMNPIASQILDLAPSCVEFVPGAEGYFIVGTYNLQKENVPQKVEESGALPVSGYPRIIKPLSCQVQLETFQNVSKECGTSLTSAVGFKATIKERQPDSFQNWRSRESVRSIFTYFHLNI